MLIDILLMLLPIGEIDPSTVSYSGLGNMVAAPCIFLLGQKKFKGRTLMHTRVPKCINQYFLWLLQQTRCDLLMTIRSRAQCGCKSFPQGRKFQVPSTIWLSVIGFQSTRFICAMHTLTYFFKVPTILQL